MKADRNSSAKFLPCTHKAQPYNPMNLVLSFLSVMRGSCARHPSGVLLCVFPPRSRIDRDMDANLSTS